jgi:membrane protein DedA with SNARE-associated domain
MAGKDSRTSHKNLSTEAANFLTPLTVLIQTTDIMLQQVLHDWLKVWFSWVEQWGYTGVGVLMALESSIVPVPSELVMPPAAFWAAQGRMNFWVVVFAGTFGSYVGSVISYFGAQWIGLPLLKRYGKYVLLPESKLEMAAQWIRTHGMMGIFLARLLPVVRHLISMPAGVFRMPFGIFSLMTLTGAFLWCWILSWFGAQVIGSNPELLNSPGEMVHVLKDKFQYFVLAIVAFAVLYFGVVKRARRART